DPQRVRRTDPGRPEICNIYSLHEYFTDEAKLPEIAEGCRTAGIGCFDCKQILAEGINLTLEPIRQRAERLRANPQEVLDGLERGRRHCQQIAGRTMDEVREAMGIGRGVIGRGAKEVERRG
ncbi:MAG: hypothetical protein JRF63_02285, partial [Deltaproteobacteria bacterium]|nr:hypothetical protein [Deltaproteobacteria bacterium]